METPLTVVYTHGIQGDLHLLPSLNTFIRQLRRDIPGRSYLIDLGMSCAPDVWPCDVTDGRAALVALDAMGYDVANVSDVLDAGSRDRLLEQVMLALVDDVHHHIAQGVAFIANETSAMPHDDIDLYVIMSPASETRLARSVLWLERISAGQVGVVRIEGTLVYRDIYILPSGTPPDATIAGAVDFIESEARYFEKRRDQHRSNGSP
ncbi:MAG: hypothetical protein ACOCX3_02040 [Chloroflexota bacterium]